MQSCDNPARTLGYCLTHYGRTRKGIPLDRPVRNYGVGHHKDQRGYLLVYVTSGTGHGAQWRSTVL